jgi:hypothetical protein
VKVALLAESYLPTSCLPLLEGAVYRCLKMVEEEAALYLALSFRMVDLEKEVVFPLWFFHPK